MFETFQKNVRPWEIQQAKTYGMDACPYCCLDMSDKNKLSWGFVFLLIQKKSSH